MLSGHDFGQVVSIWTGNPDLSAVSYRLSQAQIGQLDYDIKAQASGSSVPCAATAFVFAHFEVYD